MAYQDAYLEWVESLASDSALQAELSKIATDEAEKKDRFYQGLEFGTAGMRGKMAAGTNRMNIYTVRRATQGLADYIKKNRTEGKEGVAIAFDSRNNSARFAKEAALMLCANGIKAFLFDTLCPVAMLSFAVRFLSAQAGICITASHNPKEDNGYKVYWHDGAQISPEIARDVERCIQQHAYAACIPADETHATQAGLLTIIDKEVSGAYIAQVKSLSVQPTMLKTQGRSLKIVYSPLFGSGNLPVRAVLREMGVEPIIVKEQELPNGDFPGIRTPNPEDADALKMAIALAKREDADACFATDPDADRIGVAARARKGEYILLSGNQIGCLLLHYILSTKKKQGTLPRHGVCVKSIVSTEMARRIASDYGVRMVSTLTGFKFIAEEIEHMEVSGDGTFLFGFEESNGYLSSTNVRDKDAVNAALLLTELILSLKLKGKTLYDRLIKLYKRYGYVAERNCSVVYTGADGKAQMDAIMRRLRENPPKEIGGVPVLAVRDYETEKRTEFTSKGPLTGDLNMRSNVLYYELVGDSWVCIRPSGTEPKIKLYVNTTSRYPQRAFAEALADTIEKDARMMMQ